jgi:hypothetical protein
MQGNVGNYTRCVSRPRFDLYGRTRHLRISGAADLEHILTLTRTRWIATAAPVSAFDIDTEFLRRLDADRDGRILPHELRTAIAWTLSVLKDTRAVDTGEETLDPDTLNVDHPDGARISRAVAIVRRRTGRPDGTVSRSEIQAATDDLLRRSAEEVRAGEPPDALTSIRVKIDEYFFFCRIAAAGGAREPAAHAAWYDDQLASALRMPAVEAARTQLTQLPLARPWGGRALPLGAGVNPAYEAAVARFRADVVEPILGTKEEIDESAWKQIVDHYAPRPVSGSYADDVACLQLAIKLLVFQANLVRFANSFVSCPDLYDPYRSAAFEAGRLYLGGYAFTFTVKVPDRRFHVEIARSSNIFVLYASIRADGPPVYEIAVPVTSGTGRRFFPGKHGVFVDAHEREWHAEIVEIVTNPVSLAEAVLGPFRRLFEAITGRFEAVAREAETELDRTAAAVVPGPGVAPAATQIAAIPRPGLFGNAGSVAGAGLVVAAMTSAIAFITSSLSGVPWWHILIGVASAILAVAVPALVVGLIKLSRRDLSVILEGTKWAMNSPMRLTRRQGRFFSRRAPRRPRDTADPKR